MARTIFQEGSKTRFPAFGTSTGKREDSSSRIPFESHSIRRTDCSRVTKFWFGWSARMSANISRTVSGTRGFATHGTAEFGTGTGTSGERTGTGIQDVGADAPATKTSAASAAGTANIAATETPTASATVAAFFLIQRERSNPSTARNAPVPAIHARTAAIHQTTANAHEDAATALHAIRAKPTAIRTFAVFFQLSRKRAIGESASEARLNILAMAGAWGYAKNLSPPRTKTQEKFRKYSGIKFDLRTFVGMKYRNPIAQARGTKSKHTRIPYREKEKP